MGLLRHVVVFSLLVAIHDALAAVLAASTLRVRELVNSIVYSYTLLLGNVA
jgi:hypothetical protein